MHRWFEDWTAGRRSPGLRVYGILAYLAAWVYRCGDWWNRRLRSVVYPPLRRSRLVVVASPLIGGVGKTPVTILLARAAAARGVRPAVVTLGYKRHARGARALLPGVIPPPVDEVGDEAMEVWRASGVPVYVGDDPATVITGLDARGDAHLIIFDDGVRRRWKDERCIMVMTARDLQRPVRFVPAGRWRTHPRMLARASAVIVTIDDDMPDENIETHRQALAQWGFAGPVEYCRVKAEVVVRWNGIANKVDASPPDQTPFVFSALGMPGRFETQVHSFGLHPAGCVRFRDHHMYRQPDLVRLERLAVQAGCRWLLTSRKDVVKIGPSWVDMPVYYLQATLEPVMGDDVLSFVLTDYPGVSSDKGGAS